MTTEPIFVIWPHTGDAATADASMDVTSRVFNIPSTTYH
jgi:hypothetical protein